MLELCTPIMNTVPDVIQQEHEVWACKAKVDINNNYCEVDKSI